MAKCPKCEKHCATMRITEVDASAGGFGDPVWKGVYYSCPMCQTILGAGLDPIALKHDVATAVVKILKGAN